MTAWVIVACVSLALSVFAGWAVPAWSMKRLLPALESGGRRVTNYRGLSVPTGLGIVWLVWAASVAAVGTIVSYGVLTLVGNAGGQQGNPWFPAVLSMPFRQVVDALPLLLVAGAAGFGVVDDLFGDPTAKGFRGHLRALAGGRLTTGGLKLLGIGGLSLAAALPLTQQVAGPDSRSWVSLLTAVAIWACAALVIALSANLVNLTDLRPGRALKVYSFMVLIGVAIVIWPSWTSSSASLAFWMGGTAVPLAVDLAWTGGMKLSLLALALGPVVAVWRYDLGERAMLGDMGANAMGALAGFLLAWRSPLWLLAVLVVVLLALNLASERVSFSRVIERVGFLRWLDGLGRIPPRAPGVEADVVKEDD